VRGRGGGGRGWGGGGGLMWVRRDATRTRPHHMMRERLKSLFLHDRVAIKHV